VTDVRPTVVFADDNVRITEAVCAILGPAYNVIGVAADGESAIQYIEELTPDIAILDISMPKLNGISVARKLRSHGSNTLIVFLTLIEDEDYLDEARQIGHGYVLKRRLFPDLLPALDAVRAGCFFAVAKNSQKS
jgi:DNA-binding NarL/FixJ family response regulator